MEWVRREVLRACKAVFSEWKLNSKDWSSVVESVQSVLNHAPLKWLGLREKKKLGVYRTPLEVFTGQLPKRPLCRAHPLPNHRNITTESELLLRRLINIDKTQDVLSDLHRDVKDRSDGNRKRMTQRHNVVPWTVHLLDCHQRRGGTVPPPLSECYY